MSSKNSVIFSNLPENKARLIAWVIVGISFYLLPLVFFTLKDLRVSSGSVSPWLPEGTEERQIFNDFANRFKNHDSIHVSWEGADKEDPLFRTLTEKIIKADRMRAFQTGESPLVGSIVSLGTFIESFGETYSSDPAFRKEATAAMTGYLTSREGATGVLIIECTKFGANNRVIIFDMVDRIVRETIPPQVEPRYAGPCFLSICANEETRKVLKVITPISSLISLLIAWFFLRSPLLAIAAFSVSGLAAALSIAAIHFGGSTMGNMLSMVPSLAQLLAMSNVIHLVNYYMESLHKHGDKNRAWRDAISNGWLPTVAASLTTVIGFTALLTSNIEVVRKFSVFGTCAVLISMVIVLTSTTAILILLKPNAKPRLQLQKTFVNWLLHLTTRRKWPVTAALLSLFLFAGFGLNRHHSDIRMGSFFAEESRYQINKQWFESKMGSVMGSELLMTFHGAVDLETQFQIIGKTADKVRALDPEYSVFSPSIFYHLLRNESVDEVWKKAEKSGLGIYEDGRYQWRIAVRHPLEPDPSESVFQAQINQLIAETALDSEIRERHQPDIYLTGVFQLFSNSQDGLVNQLLRSFLCAFLVITPIIMILMRSISLGLIAMIGNLFPLVVFFGILGWIDFRIDIATMMIAAVAFGIAVDDTVHFLTWLSRGLRKYEYLENAVRYAFENCAVAILQTTLIISLGMMAFFLSDFEPSMRFAVFSGVVLVVALVGDLILLPAMIQGVFRKGFQKKKPIPDYDFRDDQPRRYEKKEAPVS